MDFTSFDIRVGTVVEATQSGDSLLLTIDLGGASRIAEARITENYDAKSIIGRQVVTITNAPGEDAVVLAAVSPSQGAVLIGPDKAVSNGTQVV